MIGIHTINLRIDRVVINMPKPIVSSSVDSLARNASPKRRRRKVKRTPVQISEWNDTQYYVFLRVIQKVIGLKKSERFGKLQQAWTSWVSQIHHIRSNDPELITESYIALNREFEKATSQEQRQEVLESFCEVEKGQQELEVVKGNEKRNLVRVKKANALQVLSYACNWRQLCRVSTAFRSWHRNCMHWDELNRMQSHCDDLRDKFSLLREKNDRSKAIEEQNSRLLLSLLVVLSVLRVRAHLIMCKLSAYRQSQGKSRKVLAHEIYCVKEALLQVST